MPDTLYSAVEDFNKAQTKKVREYSGILGLPVSTKTVKVPGRNGYVYVRLRDNDSEIIQAYNDKVSPVFNLPVIIIRQGTGWRVKDRDIERYNDWGSYAPFLPEHHFQHEFNRDTPGGDVVFIYPQQFTPVLVTPISGTSGGPNVLMQLYSFKKADGTWLQAGITGTQNLLTYRPTDNQATVAMVFLDRTSGNPGILINSGSYAPSTTTGTYGLLQYLPSLPSSDYEPLAMVRMVSGTESIEWGNIYDIRQFFSVSITGTGGGGTPGGSDTEIQVNNAGAFAGYPWLHVDTDFEYVVIGAGSPDIDSIGGLHIIGDDVTPRITLWSYGASVAGVLDFYGARGTKAVKTPLQTGDSIGRGQRAFAAYDDTGITEWPAAPNTYIEAISSENQTVTAQGAGWRIWITPRGVTAGAGYVQGLLVDERGLTVPELTGTPSTPDSGYLQIYPKSDGLYYHMDDGTEVGPLGSSTPSFDANRVVITDNAGTQTTDEHFYYDYVNNVLILGANSVPITII